MRSLDLVNSYFNREAERFDAIYEKDKPVHQQIGDNLFRRVILERFSLVVNAMGASGHSILDVGCGGGRYGIELARRGAARCVGVDVAANMIEIARAEADKHGVGDRCEWHVSGWMDYALSESFDAVAAMGYFDYQEDPVPHVKKMIAAVPTGRVFASFPKRWEVRAPVRKLRFRLANGYVRFFDRAEVLELFKSAGGSGALAFLSIVDLGRDLIAIYDAGAAAARR